VGNDVRNDAIKEIYVELYRLINEPIPQAELDLVKNYLVGSFQRSLDGPFSLADRFKGLILHNLDYNYFDRYLETLATIKPEDIAEMAVKHLHPDSMTEIIAG
jgi:zinc protease